MINWTELLELGGINVFIFVFTIASIFIIFRQYRSLITKILFLLEDKEKENVKTVQNIESAVTELNHQVNRMVDLFYRIIENKEEEK
jgi:hypothetical protein